MIIMIMKMRGSFVLLVLVAVSWGQTADELIAKNLEARGGTAKLQAIRTMMLTGSISFTDTPTPLTVKAKRPNLILEEMVVPGGEILRAFDGTTGWQFQKTKKGVPSKPTVLDDGQLDNIREEAENAIEGPLVDYAKKGSKLEALGKDTLGGKVVYKLKITTNHGTSITQYLDAETYLEIHEDIDRYMNGKMTTIVEDVSDYRAVDGVKFAHKFVSGTREKPDATTLQIDEMQLNVPLEAGAFAVPKY